MRNPGQIAQQLRQKREQLAKQAKPKPAAAQPAAQPAQPQSLDPIVRDAFGVLMESNKQIASQVTAVVDKLGQSGERTDTAAVAALQAVSAAMSEMTQAIMKLAERPVQVTVKMPAQKAARITFERDEDGRVIGALKE